MKQLFNDNWIFRFNDESAHKVTLPHDAMQESVRSKNALSKGGGAYYEGGIYTYEKTFFVPQEWGDKIIALEFEGVYQNAEVYINNRLAGSWYYGYTDFYVDISNYIENGKENVIKVVADNSLQPNSRWYTGGGIYRSVWLHIKEKARFEFDGITVKTVSVDPAKISVSAKFIQGEEIAYTVLYEGKEVAQAKGESAIIEIPDAKLWSDMSPCLYTLKAELISNGKITDTETVSFGIRRLNWSTSGFFVNGERVLLRGGCVHHDNGILGACSFAKAEERKVRILKQAGYNAIRSSHNPASKALIKACDKYGLYIINEMFDMWYMKKSQFDYAAEFEKWHLKDIERMVLSCKNNPSVIMYSVGNEVAEPCEKRGVNVGKAMVDYIHSLDDTRPVTGGFNLMIIGSAASGKGIYSQDGGLNQKEGKQKPTSSTWFNIIAQAVGPYTNLIAATKKADRVSSPLLDYMDIVGYNYGSGRYKKDKKAHPNRIIFGSETYPQDIYKNWQKVKNLPYLIGDFMWTAWDYLGEVGIGSWTTEKVIGMTFEKPYPWILSCAGAIDILGNAGAEAEYAATVWGLESKPYIGVRPCLRPKEKLTKMVWRGTNAIDSWSWENCEGNDVVVEVYSTADLVRLKLNGRDIGKKKIKKCKAIFKTQYNSGELVAIAYKNGREIGRTKLTSATENTKLDVVAEETAVDVDDIVYVAVNLVGENGVVKSNSDEAVSVSVEGGELVAFGSGVPKTTQSYLSGTFRTYYGKALAVVRATRQGYLKVYAASESGLKAETVISVK